MKAFVRVVETCSFTKAAIHLHMGRATVTQLVQQLEAHLRVKLLNRTTRQVNVTADGAAYYERIVRLLADLEDVETGLPSGALLPQGQLRVDVPSPLATLVLIPALPQFHARYPDLQLELGVSDRMVDLIGENVDCVIRGGELTDQSLAARHVGNLALGMFAAPGYLEMAGVPQHPSELGQEPHRVVSYRWSRTGKGFPAALLRGDERVQVAGRHVLSIDDGNAYLAAGVAGMGVLWLPEYMAKAPLARGELVRLFADWRLDPMPMYAAYPPNRHISRKLRVFIDWVVELMAQQAPAIEQVPLAGAN